MNPPLRQIARLLILACTMQADASSLLTDPIEPDGTWQLGTTELQYHPAAFGLSPTAGDYLMHMNNQAQQYTGTNSVIYTNTIVVGTYVVSIDVGHWNNSALLAAIGSIGMTADGRAIEPLSVTRPVPQLGQIETWKFAYTVPPGDTNLGARLGFWIVVPWTGEARNIAFDNLRIDYYLPDTVIPTIYHAAEVCWDSETNKSYRVQWATVVDATNWFDYGPAIQGTGSNICVFDSTRRQPRKFYRVLSP